MQVFFVYLFIVLISIIYEYISLMQLNHKIYDK